MRHQMLIFVRQALRITVSISIFILSFNAVAQTTRCNLVNNSAFEQGTSTTFSGWAFLTNSGAATYSVQNFPAQVESGSRAAKVVVTSPGDIYLATPEPASSQAISVFSGQPYEFSVRVWSSGASQTAYLRALEWDSTFHVVADTQLSIASAGASSWETLSGNLTVSSTTAFVSLRLMTTGAGTYYWDDALAAQKYGTSLAPKQCVDARHFVTQTSPGKYACTFLSSSITQGCVQGIKNLTTNEYAIGRRAFDGSTSPPTVSWLVDYVAHTLRSGSAIGIQKDFLYPVTAANGACYANPGEACGNAIGTTTGENAQYGPQTFPLSFYAPKVQASTYAGGVTAGATLLSDWERFDGYQRVTSSGSPTTLFYHGLKRAWVHINPAMSLGGDLGTQETLVYEEEQISPPINPAGFLGGMRLERYRYVRDRGMIYEEAWENSACKGTPNATTCDGTYTTYKAATEYLLNIPDPTNFYQMSMPNPEPENYDLVDWW